MGNGHQIQDTIKNDLIAALKERDEVKVSTLRMVQAAIKNKEIELKKREQGLNDEELMDVLAKEAKKRKDAMEAYQKGKRDDLVKKESTELAIIESYLPKKLTEEEIKREVAIVIDETGANNIKDMGKVIGTLMARHKGKVDGTQASEIVKKMLGNM